MIEALPGTATRTSRSMLSSMQSLEQRAQAISACTSRRAIRNGVAPPPNVIIDSRPLYQVDLSAFGYGISPPSSILVDMLLAGLPAAVWIDADAAMDVSNYDGLVFVSGAEEWLAFRRDARVRREMILHRQKRFLDSLEMPTDRQEVRRRFHNLLSLALGTGSHVPPPPRDAVAPPC